jgi:hypothetical protein
MRGSEYSFIVCLFEYFQGEAGFPLGFPKFLFFLDQFFAFGLHSGVMTI